MKRTMATIRQVSGATINVFFGEETFAFYSPEISAEEKNQIMRMICADIEKSRANPPQIYVRSIINKSDKYKFLLCSNDGYIEDREITKEHNHDVKNVEFTESNVPKELKKLILSDQVKARVRSYQQESSRLTKTSPSPPPSPKRSFSYDETIQQLKNIFGNEYLKIEQDLNNVISEKITFVNERISTVQNKFAELRTKYILHLNADEHTVIMDDLIFKDLQGEIAAFESRQQITIKNLELISENFITSLVKPFQTYLEKYEELKAIKEKVIRAVYEAARKYADVLLKSDSDRKTEIIDKFNRLFVNIINISEKGVLSPIENAHAFSATLNKKQLTDFINKLIINSSEMPSVKTGSPELSNQALRYLEAELRKADSVELTRSYLTGVKPKFSFKQSICITENEVNELNLATVNTFESICRLNKRECGILVSQVNTDVENVIEKIEKESVVIEDVSNRQRLLYLLAASIKLKKMDNDTANDIDGIDTLINDAKNIISTFEPAENLPAHISNHTVANLQKLKLKMDDESNKAHELRDSLSKELGSEDQLTNTLKNKKATVLKKVCDHIDQTMRAKAGKITVAKEVINNDLDEIYDQKHIHCELSRMSELIESSKNQIKNNASIQEAAQVISGLKNLIANGYNIFLTEEEKAYLLGTVSNNNINQIGEIEYLTYTASKMDELLSEPDHILEQTFNRYVQDELNLDNLNQKFNEVEKSLNTIQTTFSSLDLANDKIQKIINDCKERGDKQVIALAQLYVDAINKVEFWKDQVKLFGGEYVKKHDVRVPTAIAEMIKEADKDEYSSFKTNPTVAMSLLKSLQEIAKNRVGVRPHHASIFAKRREVTAIFYDGLIGLALDKPIANNVLNGLRVSMPKVAQPQAIGVLSKGSPPGRRML